MSTPSPTPVPYYHSDHHQPLYEQHDAFLIFDVMARYAVDRCGTEEGIDIAIMSFVMIASWAVWVVLFILVWFRSEFYIRLIGTSLTFLMFVVFLMLFLFRRPAPVSGCGLDHAWPSPYTVLICFLTALLLRYSYVVEAHSAKMRLAAISMVAVSVHSTLYIGYADAPGAFAGALIGASYAHIIQEISISCSVDTEFRKWVWQVVTVLSLYPREMYDTIVTDMAQKRKKLARDRAEPFLNTKFANLDMGNPVVHVETDPDH